MDDGFDLKDNLEVHESLIWGHHIGKGDLFKNLFKVVQRDYAYHICQSNHEQAHGEAGCILPLCVLASARLR